LANAAESEVLALSPHTLNEIYQILRDLLIAYEELGDLSSIEFPAQVLALLFDGANHVLEFHVDLGGVLEAKRPQVLKFLLLSLFIECALLGGCQFNLSLLFKIAESDKLLWLLDEPT
jgi:hypothetical protein